MKKINYKFALLQTIGIVIVVSGHLIGGGGINLASEWFPKYSYHMPLFIFISGYFYKEISEDNILNFLKIKVKKLVIPYFIWNLIYGIIITTLINTGFVSYGTKLSLRSFFIEPWISGHQYSLNIPSWFVLSLFLVQISYVVLRKLFSYLNLNNEYIKMILFLSIGVLAVYLSNCGYNTGFKLTIMKMAFFIPFFHLGYLYKCKLESIDKINSFVYFLCLFIIQFVLITKYGDTSFVVAFCNDFNRANILLPFLTSITGIAFWLRVSSILERSLCKGNKIIEYVSSNTWTIMMHHMFIIFIINSIFALLVDKIGLVGFDFQAFKNNVYYAYLYKDYRFSLFYLIACISIPLILKFYSKKLIDVIRVKVKSKNMLSQ